MKKCKTITSLQILLLLSLIIVSSAWGIYPSWYEVAEEHITNMSSINTMNPTWMSQYPDGLSISRLSIPGTHDSMALEPGPIFYWAKCQSLGLREQLDAGIRALDIRCEHYYDSDKGLYRFWIYHGPTRQRVNFGDVLLECMNFLSDNPTETILMNVQQNNTDKGTTQKFWETFEDYWSLVPQYRVWSSTDYTRIPKLGEVRGKIVLLQNFENDAFDPNSENYDTSRQFGLNFKDLDAHGPKLEEYNMFLSREDFDRKWGEVKEHLYDAAFYDGEEKIYITFISGSSNWLWDRDPTDPDPTWFAVPWDVAAGYHELSFPWGVVHGMNERTLNFLKDGNIPSSGIIMMDFPGPGLIEEIIALNSNIVDIDKPVMTLLGESEMVLECGVDTFIDPGATVEDDFDSDVTVVIGGDTVDPLQPGIYTITYDATDNAGNAAEQVTRTVIVQDNLPPKFQSLSATPGLLWPSNHKLMPVNFYADVVDICDSKPSVVLTSVKSNEPDDARGGGDGHTKRDIREADIGMPDFSILLRAERLGKGDGRIYSITYSATDDSGNQATSEITVTVPHDDDLHRKDRDNYSDNDDKENKNKKKKREECRNTPKGKANMDKKRKF